MGETPAGNIVMTPKCKTANSTTLIIERKQSLQNSVNGNTHIAGGDHKGIVINKEAHGDAQADSAAQLSLQFRVFLVNAQTGRHTQESRTLQFWFVPHLSEAVQAHVAQDFFKELVSPQEFPRDYVGFIKKIMKLMQRRYTDIRRIEIELRQLEDVTNPPTRPLAADEVSPGQQIELTEEKVLELIESAYPNPITIQEIAKEHGWDEELVAEHLHQLQAKGLVKPMDHGAFTRLGHADTEIQIVKNMPTMVSAKQPTIAVITAQYCEKLAVDAMLENRETFVRYTTVGLPAIRQPDGTLFKPTRFGESNVYTLGNIGDHRVVCTKLPTVGHTREAMTAAGNTTTRLLGTFQKVDYVLLVGVGGGVPHYTDYSKHVRLGDVVVSAATPSHKYVYTYCGFVKANEDGSYDFETKEYNPPNTILQEIAAKIKAEEGGSTSWQKYLNEGLKTLQSNETEHDFRKPDSDSDKLYMSIGEHDVIEVAHPLPAEGVEKGKEGNCRIHLGPVASGRKISREDTLRQLYSAKFGTLAYDSEFDAVVESVLGNCRENFVVIRGMADYKDGTRRSEWQPFASLAAASVMKALIYGLDVASD